MLKRWQEGDPTKYNPGDKYKALPSKKKKKKGINLS